MVRLNRAPVVGEAAVRVPHRVRVFAHDERARVVNGVGERGNLLDGGVHGAHKVNHAAPPRHGLQSVARLVELGAAVALVVDDARGVHVVQPRCLRVLVLTRAAFVPQRPREDAGVVLVAPVHPLHAKHIRSRPLVASAHHVVVGVVLDVRLVHDVDAVAVAQVVPALVVGVVAGAHGVEVVPLQQKDVALHLRDGERLSRALVVLVAVHAVDVDAPAVDAKLAVLDGDRLEADGARGAFDEAGRSGGGGCRVVGAVRRRGRSLIQAHAQDVEGGRFARPELGRLDGKLGAGSRLVHAVVVAERGAAVGDEGARLRLFARRVVQLVERVAYGAAERVHVGLLRQLSRARRVAERHGELYGARRLPVVRLHARERLHVGKVCPLGAVQVDAPVDAAEPPLVLVFHKRGVRVAHHLERHQRLARAAVEPAHAAGDVELGGKARVLAQAHEVAVHVGEQAAFGAPHVEHDAAVPPRLRHAHAQAVQARGVVRGGEGRRLAERHLHVGVVRLVVALHRPGERHGERLPA